MAQSICNWNLIEAAGRPINNNTEVIIDETSVRYRYGNNFSQTYQVDGNNIRFGPAISTRMYSPQDPPEQEVWSTITESTNWTVEGDTLELFSGSHLHAQEILMTN